MKIKKVTKPAMPEIVTDIQLRQQRREVFNPETKRTERVVAYRSRLLNLTKEQVIETLIAQFPAVAFCHIAPFLTKKINRRTALFIEEKLQQASNKALALMELTHEMLVDISYSLSDSRLNYLYGQNHQTTPTERRQDVRRSSFTLIQERSLQVKPAWKKEWKNRDQAKYAKNSKRVLRKAAMQAALSGVKLSKELKFKAAPRTARQTKAVTKSWISAMRSHNKVITHQSEPEFICGKC